MKIYTKNIVKNEYENETRWFADTNDGFDGTAQGYGYKSKEKLMKSYWYHKNRHMINKHQNDTKKFLKENPDVKHALTIFFDEDNMLIALKNREKYGIDEFILSLSNKDEWNNDGIDCNIILEKMMVHKELWRNILDFI